MVFKFQALALSFLSLLSFGQDLCYDAYDCSSDTLDDADIYCDGYYACQESSITVSDELDCSGDNGCFLASIVAENGADVDCFGWQGCLRAHIINEEGEILCHGAQACVTADMIGYTVYLDGWMSGYQSVFTADSSTETHFAYYNYGYLSGAYGDVIVGDGNSLSLQYYGYYAGYRNYIDCESGSTCSLTCSGLGCSDTELFCYSGATCTYDCSNADTCPTVYSISSAISGSKALNTDTDTSDTTSSKKNKRRLLEFYHETDEDLKNTREERRTFREKVRPIDEKKWSKQSKMFAKFVNERDNNDNNKQERKRISNHDSKKETESKTSFISKSNNNIVKDLASRHILYGVGIASAIYFVLTLIWYFTYYKPRKNELYTVV